jgi:hypothetical protein
MAIALHFVAPNLPFQMTAQRQLRAEPEVVPNETESAEASLLGLVSEGTGDQVYNEAAFRYFLSLERKRSERSGDAFLLLLVDLEFGPGQSVDFEPDLAARVFLLMKPCLRETDFVGWYHAGKVAAAVLTQVGDAGPDASDQVTRRVRASLLKGVPAAVSGCLRVGVYQLPSRTGRS